MVIPSLSTASQTCKCVTCSSSCSCALGGDGRGVVGQCNRLCDCPPTCPFKYADVDPSVELQVFRKPNGWGVRSLRPISAGQFVMRITGELVQWKDAKRRIKEEKITATMFVFSDRKAPAIDLSHFGNVGRFLDTACQPNLCLRKSHHFLPFLYPSPLLSVSLLFRFFSKLMCAGLFCIQTPSHCTISSLSFSLFLSSKSSRFPDLLLFAMRSISANEELFFEHDPVRCLEHTMEPFKPWDHIELR